MHLFQAGVVREITGHVSDALNKYQETSNAQKCEVGLVLNPSSKESESPKAKKVKQTPVSPIPSLEMSVTDKSEKVSGYQCECLKNKFNLDKANELGAMINDIVSKRKGGKAKIKLEIEFSN